MDSEIIRRKIIFLIVPLFIMFQGCGSGPSGDCPEPTIPPPPSNIKVEKGNSQVTITWDNVQNADYYNLYYSVNEIIAESEEIIKIPKVNSSYIHQNLSANIYYYVVTSVISSVRGEWESLYSEQKLADLTLPYPSWVMSSASYQVFGYALDTGILQSSSSSFRLINKIGQSTPIGFLQSTSYITRTGFIPQILVFNKDL